MLGKYHLAKVRPARTILPNVAYAADDVMFDWYRFEIPRGGCTVKSINVIHPGTNATAVTGLDLEILFATSVNGVAPPTLGNPHDAITVINATACKNHIIGYKYLDASVLENRDILVGYNVWTQTSGQSVGYDQLDMVIEGDPNYPGTTKGYQSVWMAVIAIGTDDFGTGVLLDGTVHTANAGAQVLDVSEDVDADDVFAVGDELLACASDGSSVQEIGTITALTADAITINAKDIFGTTVWSSGGLTNDDEICFKRPLTFNIGLEY